MNSTREKLKEIMGDNYKGLLGVFLSDSSKRLNNILKAGQGNDMETLTREAHTLKGSCSNLGAQQLLDVCAEIEQLARNNSTQGMSKKLDEVEHVYHDLKQELEKELSLIS